MKNVCKAIFIFLLIIILSLILIFTIMWGCDFARCEYLTSKYGYQFEELYKENTMITDTEELKVIDYSDNFARVYYVSKGKTDGNILTFKKDNDKWKYFSWEETVWSSSGSADGFVWPYGR